MHFSEDDLREALKRKDLGEGFTQRTMARVNQAKSETKPVLGKLEKKNNGAFLGWWMHRPAWAMAVVAMLLLAFGIGGYQYSEYRHAEEIRTVQERQRQLQQEAEKMQQEAERARDQAIMALEIARAKMNHVLRHAQLQAEPNDKIRRERL
jgi:cytochrome c-type biogenesis protein CcmH/NrfG